MRALIQKVKWAKVQVKGESELTGEIQSGVLTFLGVKNTDTETQAKKIIEKISRLRIFEDEQGKMNLSMLDLKQKGIPTQHLIVSQFTLYGDTQQGNRPGFSQAAPQELAQSLYQKAILHSKALGLSTQSGRFQSHMEVSLLNDGPITFLIEIE